MKRPIDFQRITILGPGLLGGSLGLALKSCQPACEVVMWGRKLEVAQQALEIGAADRAESCLESAVSGADLVILATPVETMAGLIEKICSGENSPQLAENAIITDVGSVKQLVHNSAGQIAQRHGLSFIGSHPMAGSENQGLAAAKKSLFTNSVCILTNEQTVEKSQLARLEYFWESLGCRCAQMTADEHDKSIAKISHWPHIASVLTTSIAIDENGNPGQLAGNGFRDTTRISQGDPGLWAGILLENRAALLPLLDEAQLLLADLREILARNDAEKLRGILAKAAASRAKVYPFPRLQN